MVENSPNPLVKAIQFNFRGGKAYHEMFGVFTPLFEEGKLRAYEPEEDREEVLNDNSNERITRTRKGVTLKRIPGVPQHNSVYNKALVLQKWSDAWNTQGVYILKAGTSQAYTRDHHAIHTMELEKMVKEFVPAFNQSFDFWKAVPNELLHPNQMHKAWLQIKDRYIASRLTAKYHYFGDSLNFTEVVAEIRSPEIVDGFLMNIIQGIRADKGVPVSFED